MRRYRGRDIWHWLKEAGDLDRTLEEASAAGPVVKSRTMTLSGANGGEQLDLGVLRSLGVVLAGHVEGFGGTEASFTDDLSETAAEADLHMRVVLDEIDDHLERTSPHWGYAPDRLPDLNLEAGPLALDLAAHGISTVIWATGFRRAYPWLHVPMLDAAGEVVHRHGITSVEGLYVLGMRFQRSRASHIIGGVGADAAFLAEQIVGRLAERASRRWNPARILAARGVGLQPLVSPC
jgi:putative flavoprotein involved in K+ transport